MVNHSRREFISNISKGVVALNAGAALGGYMDTNRQNKTGYIYEPKYLEHQASPESPDRLRAIKQKLEDTRLVQNIVKLPVLEGSVVPYLKAIHTDQHIDSVSNIPVTGDVANLAIAGALGAVKAVSEGVVDNAFCAIRPPGHHAHNNGGEEGFCFYSNVAVAARYAQNVCKYEKVLIIDWDFHHGNGTQDATYTDPSVLFFSTHNWLAYPGTGDPAKQGTGEKYGLNINVHLEAGAQDIDMLRAWEEKLLPKAEQFKPDFVFISAGFDSRKDDLLGNLMITDDCFARITKMAMDIANTHCNGRLVSLLEGGYNVSGLAEAVFAHVGTMVRGDSSLVNNLNRVTPQIQIKKGILRFSGGLEKEVAAISVYDIAGTTLKKIMPEHITGVFVNLNSLGLADGFYLVSVTLKSGKVLTQRFNLINL
jgi:acetoin utilization deacetylase AcuC-like enzyme